MSEKVSATLKLGRLERIHTWLGMSRIAITYEKRKERRKSNEDFDVYTIYKQRTGLGLVLESKVMTKNGRVEWW